MSFSCVIFKENYRWEICVAPKAASHSICQSCMSSAGVPAALGLGMCTFQSWPVHMMGWTKIRGVLLSQLLHCRAGSTMQGGCASAAHQDESLGKRPIFTDRMLNSRRFTLHGNNLSLMNPWKIKSQSSHPEGSRVYKGDCWLFSPTGYQFCRKW